ncbi:MAG: hypothetical protein IPN13_04060 [Bacteroidetes bacterium]|nr:hypothetical protein [Bacteroidota bacterium]
MVILRNDGLLFELAGADYVWDKYSQVVVRDYVSGAMENTSAHSMVNSCKGCTRFAGWQ